MLEYPYYDYLYLNYHMGLPRVLKRNSFSKEVINDEKNEGYMGR
jgi:hypothetical protein